MKKLVIVCGIMFCFVNYSLASEIKPIFVSNVIKGSVSITSRVPSGFFGSWKVVSVRSKTNNPKMFAPYSVDIWNLIKVNDVITLSNPISGAKASVSVNSVNGPTVKFEKISYDIDEKSVETPTLTLEGDNFYGTDKIVVSTYKDDELVKEDFVEYKVKAYKISGNSLPGIFGR